jgi:hypothetical protein
MGLDGPEGGAFAAVFPEGLNKDHAGAHSISTVEAKATSDITRGSCGK